ncbi:MAG: sulfatase-like hydrolase/transferase [Verrucomicrobiaceae bacterium]|nr:sulfatase-like hydrolase/transferase [Verrucomicrobiaceae bacterium]
MRTLFILIALCSSLSTFAAQPNIIFIEVDDLLYTYTSVWGSKTSPTPTMDRLAKAGFVFDQAMCQGMMCGPSRNSLMSGKYPHQLGFYQNGDMKKLPEKTWTLPHELKKNGYTTAWIGKSHLKPFFANKKAKTAEDTFNEFFGFDHSLHTLGRALVGDDDREEGGKDSGPNPYMQFLEKSGYLDQYKADAKAGRNSTIPEDAYLDGWFAKNTVDYIASYDKAKPLFLWVNFSVPHGPYDVADPYHQPFENAKMPGITKVENYEHPESLIKRTRSYGNEKKAIEDQRGFHANIAFMDHSVDRILTALKEKDMLDNSWIVFFSDQGVMSGAHGLIHKSTLFRPVTQPSLIIRPPNGIPAGKRLSQPVELMDLLPTFLEIGGMKSSKAPAGVSLTPLFKGEPITRTHTFAEIEDWIVVSDGHYRLIRSVKDEGAFLFDDLADPENLKNIAKDKPEVVKSLGEQIDTWLKQTGERLKPKTM